MELILNSQIILLAIGLGISTKHIKLVQMHYTRLSTIT